ncbi:unnamed protein product [Sympodiomycopsis kandeliae]
MSNTLPKLSKRKVRPEFDSAIDADNDVSLKTGDDYDSDDSSSSDPSFINVDFDFRAPSEIDEAALRRLLRQLFNTHSNALQLHQVSEKIIELASSQGLGTVIKVEGDEDQDPFGFVSAIPLGGSDAASQLLSSYLSKQLPTGSPLSSLVSSPSSVIYLHERFINLPAQTAPPLYRILTDEVSSSSSSAPSHVFFFSRVFSSDAYSDDEDADQDEDKPRGLKGATKRRKKIVKDERGEKKEWGYFRPEDEILERFASHTHTFRFPPPQEAEESYESPLYGRIVVVDWNKIVSGEIWNQMDIELGMGVPPQA